MGIEYERDEHLFWFDRFIIVDVFRLLVHCYQYRHEFLCYVAVPKCDPVSRHVIHPCREMCQDAKIACGRVGFYKHLNCSYLPSKDENITCIYERVFCRAPPKVKNAAVKTNSSKSFALLKPVMRMYDVADYSCDEGYGIMGNKSISCTYSGQWTTPPTCSLKPIDISKSSNLSHKINESKSSNLSQEIIRSTSSNLNHQNFKSKTSNLNLNHAYAVLPTMFILLALLFLIFVVRYKMKSNKKDKICTKIKNDQVNSMLPQEEQISVSSSDPIPPLKKKRTFDAALFYHFDTDEMPRTFRQKYIPESAI